MDSDISKYHFFTARSRMEKSVNSLIGLVEGISIDGVVNEREMSFIHQWLMEHAELKGRHPYNELIPVLEAAVADGVFSSEERADITWLCERLRSTEFYNQTTADLQRLHGIVGGIIADGVVTEAELKGLSLWMGEHEHLKTCWPYDEISSLITSVMADKRIDEKEQVVLKAFFSEFVAVLDEKTIVSPQLEITGSFVGLCAVCPEIEFEGRKFCFTGASARHTRSALSKMVQDLGGEVATSLTSSVSYLIVGAEGNPCWAFACYGRKVEKAVDLRKAGSRVMVIHENDFHDAVADYS
jgi:NAD-dependent DNA ligase